MEGGPQKLGPKVRQLEGLLLLQPGGLPSGQDEDELQDVRHWDIGQDDGGAAASTQVHGESVEGDDCGAGHLGQEGGEPGRTGRQGPT